MALISRNERGDKSYIINSVRVNGFDTETLKKAHVNLSAYFIDVRLPGQHLTCPTDINAEGCLYTQHKHGDATGYRIQRRVRSTSDIRAALL